MADLRKELMKPRPIFNPEGNDDPAKRGVLYGDTTNIFNLNVIKYEWAPKLYRVMMANFWIPETVDLTQDVQDYKELTDDERQAYDEILSFLVFLDSIQTTNIPNIAAYVKAPEITIDLSIHAYQEAIHSQSYGYTIESVVPPEKREEVYYWWRKDPILFERNKYIADIYQKFLEEPTMKNYGEVLIGNYLLEGLYFYNGFMFFYNLASRNLMQGTADIIRYINRDELTHVILFEHFMKDLTDEGFKKYLTKDKIYEMFRIAVDQEQRFSKKVIGNKILGMNEQSIEDYTYYIANKRLKSLGLEPIFPDRPNPYEHLERIADTGGEGNVKANFFEATVTSYNQASAVEGWDEI